MRHRGVRAFFSATGDDGTVVVLVALLLSALVASAGVAVDGGVGYVERQMMQSAADAAATAGTLEMQRSWNGESFGELSQAMIESVATAYAAMNRWISTNGTLTVNYLLDPANPIYNKQPGMKLYRQIMAKYDPKGNANDGLNLYGVAKAWNTVKVLQAAGKNLTRAGLMKAVTHMNEVNNPFLVPGVKVHTTPTFRFPISAVQLQRWHNGHWEPFGAIQSAKP